MYDVDIPVFYIPQTTLMQFADAPATGHLLVDKSWTGSMEPVAILIASDARTEKYKNKNLDLLRTVLHEIGHWRMHDSLLAFVSEMIESHKNLLEKEGGRAGLLFLMTEGTENRVEKWAKSEWRKLRAFVNARRTGWRKGLRFDHVRSVHRYNEDEYRDLFDTGIFKKTDPANR